MYTEPNPAMSANPLSENTSTLNNLPEEFRNIFIRTNDQIRYFGDGILLVEFSFLINNLAFATDLEEEAMTIKVNQFRDLIYRVFDDNAFVDREIRKLQENEKAYVQGIYAQGTVFLCTSLECFIKRLFTVLINYDKTILENEIFKKYKNKLEVDFRLNGEEISSELVDNLLRKINSAHKSGFEKLECYLTALGLHIDIDTDKKQILTILYQLRNCIVHNNSIIDSKFCKQCSWTTYKVGNKIVITKDEFRAFETSILSYMSGIFISLNIQMGAPERIVETLRKMSLEIII
jgi:hypothetical protein